MGDQHTDSHPQIQEVVKTTISNVGGEVMILILR